MSPAASLSHATVPLAGGVGSLPSLGFGMLIRDTIAAARAVRVALETGFRHLDGAELYANEGAVGEAIHSAMDDGIVRRDELFLTTKLWNNNHRPERVRPALQASLGRMRLEFVDAYLVHTPYAFKPGDDMYPSGEDGSPVYDEGVTLAQTWEAMEALVDAGLCRCIGITDIRLDKLKELVGAARIKPAIVQVESHPYLPEWEMLEYCRDQGIVFVAGVPLGHGMAPHVTQDPVIVDIAHRVGKTSAQVGLAWAIQRGGALLTTSTNPDHIRENFDITALPDEAMEAIRTKVTTRVRLNDVVSTGVPGFLPRGR